MKSLFSYSTKERRRNGKEVLGKLRKAKRGKMGKEDKRE